MTPELNNTFSCIKKQVNLILLNSTFADRVDPYAKISEMITFPEDIDIIKQNIKRIFKYDIDQDVANMTPYELILHLYNHNKNFNLKTNTNVLKQPAPSASNITQKSNNTEWSRKTIFAYILASVSRPMGRTVQSSERISDLMAEAAMSGTDLEKLNLKLKELEKFFGIKIDQSMKLYNVANAAEISFIAQGRAPAHNDINEQKDPLWDVLMMATSMKYLKSILQHNMQISVSTYALSHLKSYEEYVKLIQDAQMHKAERLKKQSK